MNENNFFCCPLCKGQLEKHELEYECKLCNKKFKQTEKYKNFLIEVNYIDKRTSLDYINKLLDEINVQGYYKGVDNVLKETPSLEFELKNTKWSRTLDGSFHGI